MSTYTSVYTKREAEQIADLLDALRDAESELFDAEQALGAFLSRQKEEEDALVAVLESAKAKAKAAAWMFSRVGNTVQSEALRRYAAQLPEAA